MKSRILLGIALIVLAFITIIALFFFYEESKENGLPSFKEIKSTAFAIDATNDHVQTLIAQTSTATFSLNK